MRGMQGVLRVQGGLERGSGQAKVQEGVGPREVRRQINLGWHCCGASNTRIKDSMSIQSFSLSLMMICFNAYGLRCRVATRQLVKVWMQSLVVTLLCRTTCVR
jgi:hypothetical protein